MADSSFSFSVSTRATEYLSTDMRRLLLSLRGKLWYKTLKVINGTLEVGCALYHYYPSIPSVTHCHSSLSLLPFQHQS